jgi:RsiW-degrading membrane proteinase PrsW (M82 family)
MVYLQNPPSDEDERKWEDTLTFFYLLAIEMIPPFFMLILEPFKSTSCYADSCQSELIFYIYSRYVFVLGIVLVKFIYVLVFSYLRRKMQKLLQDKKGKGIFYQDKLASMLKQAMDDSKKP